jgi:catechol 2,3-dioxygenase-like lactoylglutathione lyase family enzyme
MAGHIQTVNVIRHTRDFETMRHFYHDQLGFEIVEEWDEPGNRGAVVQVANQATLEILSLDDLAKPGIRPENLELGIHIDDAHIWLDRLVAAGVTIARGIEDAPWGHRSFGVDDPDGLRIWFVQVLRETSGEN